MPMTLIEAMGTGLPIVATSVGGVPDMLTDGTSALLTPCDPDAVARACVSLLEREELRQTAGAGGQGTECSVFCRIYGSGICESVRKISFIRKGVPEWNCREFRWLCPAYNIAQWLPRSLDSLPGPDLPQLGDCGGG